MNRFTTLILMALVISLTACGEVGAASKGQVFEALLTSQRAGGVTLAGGKAYFYVPGTTTYKAIYADRNKTTPAANPYTLSADGTAMVYGDGLYDVKITNSAGVQKFLWEDIQLTDFGSPDASTGVLVVESNGAYTTATNISDANTNVDYVGKTIVITVPITQTANIILATDRAWKFEKGAVITTTGYTLNVNGAPVEAGNYQIFAGTGSVTGLASPLVNWFADNTTPGTTDMTAAIQRAIDATTGNIRFLAQRYACGDINLKSNLKVIAEAGATIVRTGNLGWTMGVNTALVDNINIDGLIFDNNAPGTAGANKISVYIRKATNVKIRNCKFYNGYDISIKDAGPDGIYLGSLDTSIKNNLLIENCTFDGFTRNGISMTDGVNTVTVKDCIFTNNGLSGIDVEANTNTSTQVYNLRITGCKFIDNGNGAIRGTDVIPVSLQIINASGATAYHSNNVVVENCYFKTTTAVNTLGIVYFKVTSTRDFTMSNCVFDSPDTVSPHYVVYESSTFGSTDGKIYGNTFNNVEVQAYSFTNLQMYNNLFKGGLTRIIGGTAGPNKSLVNNIFYAVGDATHSPITLGSYNTLIVSNVFLENRASGVPALIIKTALPTTTLSAIKWKISGNTVSSTSAKYGAFFNLTGGSGTYGISDLIVTDNSVSNCDLGVSIASSAAFPNSYDISIQNNSFSDITTQAINMNGISRFTVSGNRIKDCATNTIALNITRSDRYLCANNAVVDTRASTARSTYAISAANTAAGTPTSLLIGNLSINTQSGFTLAAGEGTAANNVVY